MEKTKDKLKGDRRSRPSFFPQAAAREREEALLSRVATTVLGSHPTLTFTPASFARSAGSFRFFLWFPSFVLLSSTSLFFVFSLPPLLSSTSSDTTCALWLRTSHNRVPKAHPTSTWWLESPSYTKLLYCSRLRRWRHQHNPRALILRQTTALLNCTSWTQMPRAGNRPEAVCPSTSLHSSSKSPSNHRYACRRMSSELSAKLAMRCSLSIRPASQAWRTCRAAARRTRPMCL